ncbi:MAG TPA: DNA repair protein RecO [Bellilinea sp.]|nr:DNA repair protein RecO [Bellilinea sp.]
MPRQERTLKVDAVVLRHQDWGEADRLLTVYSREAGKLRVIAKGARKLISRKAGHIQPFSRVQMVLSKGRDLWILTQVETLDGYSSLRADLEKIGQASYAVELLDKFTYEDSATSGLFTLLTDTMSRLNKEPDPFIALRYFEVHLLEALGFKPELKNCVRCDAEIQAQDQYFSSLYGGVLCPNCGPLEAESRRVTLDALRFLRHFQRSSYADSLRAKINENTRLELENLLQQLLTYHLERNLNSTRVMREINRSLPDKNSADQSA